MRKLVLDTPLVQIHDIGTCYEMMIRTKNGSIIEHEPFPHNLEGMVAAISLSAEICAGKFYLSKVISVPEKLNAIEHKNRGRLA
jgi:hypothetical protein